MSKLSSSSTSSIWTISYKKLQFFSRIRRFLQSKTIHKTKPRTKNLAIKPLTQSNSNNNNIDHNIDKDDHVIQSENIEDGILGLQRSVKRLHFGSSEEKELAALEIERLLLYKQEDVDMRKFMAELGVIPPLVGMVAARRPTVALRALFQLANGSFTNKAIIVEAGIFTKLPKNIDVLEQSTLHECARLFESLSSLTSTQSPLKSTQPIVTFLIGVLDSCAILDTKVACLGALYNLSVALHNAGIMVSIGVIQALLKVISVKEIADKVLATLANLVVTLTGKKVMEDSPLVPESLIEIIMWNDKPKCQELSVYILMILAHQSWVQREKMEKFGIVPVLTELSLLGSPLTQKRAGKILQWFKDERQTKMGPHSGPQTRRATPNGSPLNEREAQQGRRMMKNLVKQSLYKNLEVITKRASYANDGESTNNKLKALVISTSSKSLHY